MEAADAGEGVAVTCVQASEKTKGGYSKGAYGESVRIVKCVNVFIHCYIYIYIERERESCCCSLLLFLCLFIVYFVVKQIRYCLFNVLLLKVGLRRRRRHLRPGPHRRGAGPRAVPRRRDGLITMIITIIISSTISRHCCCYCYYYYW